MNNQPTPKVAIIIVNWNSGKLLNRCISALKKQHCAPGELIIVDNASTDSSTTGLEKYFPNIKIIRLDKNIGFAAGNNRALKQCSAEFVALLNSDAFPEPDWLECLLSAANKYPEYSFFASRLVQANHPDKLDGEGDVMHISGLAWREGHDRPVTSGAIKPREIFCSCAAAALYRRNALEEAGGFDEDYFCYFEDVDLGFKLRLAGHRCLSVPDAVAYHVGSASTGGQNSDFAIYYGHRNLVWTYVKNMPGAIFWLTLPLHIVMNIAIIAWFSIHGKSRVILRAKYDAFCGIPRMWKKRRCIQKNRSASTEEIWKVLNKNILPRLFESFRR